MFPSNDVVKSIFYINVICYLLSLILPGVMGTLFPMYPIGSQNFHWYQLITYQFMHGGLMHILFNMLIFLSLGSTVADYYGSKKFLIFYLLSGIAGALLQALVQPDVVLLGASASIFGVMIMYVFLYPNDELYLFLIPIPIKAKYLIGALFAFECYASFNVIDKVSHFGHVGGGIMGAILFLMNRYKIIK